MKIFSRALVVPASVLMCVVAWPSGLSAQIKVQQTFCTGATPCVWTYHNDNTRGGVNPNETILTPTFADDYALAAVVEATDGLVYAQPLYVKNLDDSSHKIGACPSPANMVFVATENNSVYAFAIIGGTPVTVTPAGSCP